MGIETGRQSHRLTAWLQVAGDPLQVDVTISTQRGHEENRAIGCPHRTGIQMSATSYPDGLASVGTRNPDGRRCDVADVLAHEELEIVECKGDQLVVG
jgi:hypothetical protein